MEKKTAFTKAKTVNPMIASLISKTIPRALSNPTILFASKKIQLSATKNPTKDSIQRHLGGLSALVPAITRTAIIQPAVNPNTRCHGSMNSLTIIIKKNIISNLTHLALIVTYNM